MLLFAESEHIVSVTKSGALNTALAVRCRGASAWRTLLLRVWDPAGASLAQTAGDDRAAEANAEK